MQGDPRQQGGCFIISTSLKNEPTVHKEYKTLWCHYDRHNADQVPIPVLFAAGNISQDLWKFSGYSIAEGYSTN